MTDYKGYKCVSCHKMLEEGDDIVICPECGAPYHRACYAAEGRCVLSAKHGVDFEYIPPEAKPAVNADGPVCPACGAQNPPDALFCERCGKPMRAVEPPLADSTPQYAQGHAGADAGADVRYAAGNVMTQLHLAKEYDGIDTQDWMKYIGNSAPYYLYQFQRMNESGRRTGFCWSALLLPEFYFFYRKMWGWGALALAVTMLASALPLLSLAAAAGVSVALPFSAQTISILMNLGGALNWGMRISACLFAFDLFRKNAAKQMRAMRQASADAQAYQDTLARRGGPSRIAVVLAGVLQFACVLAFYAWVGPERMMAAFYLY